MAGSSSKKRPALEQNLADDDLDIDMSGCKISNYPCLIVPWCSGESEDEEELEGEDDRVTVKVQLPFGATSVDVSVVNDGYALFVSYEWVAAMCNVNTVLGNLPEEVRTNKFHPLVTGTKAAINRMKTDAKKPPLGSIEVALPFAVDAGRGRLTFVTEAIGNGACYVLKVDAARVFEGVKTVKVLLREPAAAVPADPPVPR